MIPIKRCALLFAGLLLASSMARPAWAANPGEIKFGLILTLTGPYGVWNQTAKMALEDHVKEINAKGGIKGRKINLITYDTEGDLVKVDTGARKLIDQDQVVGIIGPEGSMEAFSLAPLAESAKIPVIATTASATSVTLNMAGSVKPFMFRVCPIDPYQASILANFAIHDLKMRKAAILYDSWIQPDQDFMLDFYKAFTGLGGQVVAQANYKWEETKFRDQLNLIEKSKPDFLFIPADSYRAVAQIAKEAKSMGLKFQFFGEEGWSIDDLLTMAGNELEGSYLTSGISTKDPRFADYNAKFSKAHNMEIQVAAYYALDAIMALEHAAKVSMDKTTKIDTTIMNDTLEHMKDVPVFTGTLTYDPKTHNPINKPMTIITVKNAKWVIVKTVMPD